MKKNINLILVTIFVVLSKLAFAQQPAPCEPKNTCNSQCQFVDFRGFENCPNRNCILKFCFTSWYNCYSPNGITYSTSQCNSCEKDIPDDPEHKYNTLATSGYPNMLCWDSGSLPEEFDPKCHCDFI